MVRVLFKQGMRQAAPEEYAEYQRLGEERKPLCARLSTVERQLANLTEDEALDDATLQQECNSLSERIGDIDGERNVVVGLARSKFSSFEKQRLHELSENRRQRLPERAGLADQLESMVRQLREKDAAEKEDIEEEDRVKREMDPIRGPGKTVNELMAADDAAEDASSGDSEPSAPLAAASPSARPPAKPSRRIAKASTADEAGNSTAPQMASDDTFRRALKSSEIALRRMVPKPRLLPQQQSPSLSPLQRAGRMVTVSVSMAAI
mmetsp:Transcript_69087/g.122174  ORF Transcript_69087/g.122174 Transcript_69087/m.122174 type:complete len:265 (+) Transcript_69087:88-882(+)